MAEQKQVVVLGSGPAGYVCAIRLAQLGKKVTVIERAEVGGVCLNRGCIPSKALIHAGATLQKFSQPEHLASMGITIEGVDFQFGQLMKWKESVVKKLTSGVSSLLKANGCTVLQGEAQFTGPKTLEVKTATGVQSLTFEQCVIATGSRPTDLKGFEVDQKQIFDSTGILSLEKAPRSLLCIGGGYIGLELGSFYSKIGTAVTVVEAGPGLLLGVDAELTQVVAKKLKKNGVTVYLKHQIKGCKKTASGVEVSFSGEQGEQKITVDAVLVTIGRTPNSENLGLALAGISVDAKGFIPVNRQRQTQVSGIYAIGDIAGQPLLAHKGSKEGMVAAEAIAGLKTVYDVLAMPAVIFTDPEIATVGLTDVQAKEQGTPIRVGVFPYAANGRALSIAEPEGFVKMVGHAETGKLLGVHIVGAEASNLISEAALALEMGAQVEDLALTVHPHPTLSEMLMEDADATLGHAIHIYQKPVRAQAESVQ